MRTSALRSLFATATLALSATSALAGDKDLWSGFYIGAHLGHTWNASSLNLNVPDNANIPDQTVYPNGFEKSGTAGGVQVGYQRKLGMFVPGVEFAYTRHKVASTSFITDTTDTRALTGTIGDIFTATARLGVTHERWLAYAKGGAAWGDVDFSSMRFSDGATQTSSSGRSRGFTYGGGLEYALKSDLSLGADYTFTQLHVERSGIEDPATGTTPSSVTGDPTVKSLMLRLNYKFAPSLF